MTTKKTEKKKIPSLEELQEQAKILQQQIEEKKAKEKPKMTKAKLWKLPEFLEMVEEFKKLRYDLENWQEDVPTYKISAKNTIDNYFQMRYSHYQWDNLGKKHKPYFDIDSSDFEAIIRKSFQDQFNDQFQNLAQKMKEFSNKHKMILSDTGYSRIDVVFRKLISSINSKV